VRKILRKFKLIVRNYWPRKLVASPNLASGNFTSVLINALISAEKNHAFNEYLEIGSQFGYTLEAVKIPYRIGIDPNPMHNVKNLPTGVESLVLASNEFFTNQIDQNKKFDFIFIDGLHVFSQVYMDFVNSCNHLSKGGFILLDDIIPVDIFSADTDQIRGVSERNLNGNNSKSWQGDCFKLLHLIANEMPFMNIKTFIYPGNAQALIKFKSLSNRLEFSQDLYNKYNTLTFEETFRDFKSAAELYNFEFGWNIYNK